MASAEDILARMRRTPYGHRSSDYRKVLVYYGFREREKKARHGVFMKHDELAASADPATRQLSWMIIPNGCEDKGYLTDQVIDRVTAAQKLSTKKGA